MMVEQLSLNRESVGTIFVEGAEDAKDLSQDGGQSVVRSPEGTWRSLRHSV